MKEYNHKIFMEKLELAKGSHRTFYQYCQQSGVDRSTISRVVNNKNHNLKAETFYLLSQYALNAVSFEDLMLAYGYEKAEIPNTLQFKKDKESYEINKEYRNFINDKSNYDCISMLIDAKKKGILEKIIQFYNTIK
jgi:transcriptional regulator with XRE-family HTH domain